MHWLSHKASRAVFIGSNSLGSGNSPYLIVKQKLTEESWMRYIKIILNEETK